MFCPNCGTNAGSGAYCPNCGTKMPISVSAPQSPVIKEDESAVVRQGMASPAPAAEEVLEVSEVAPVAMEAAAPVQESSAIRAAGNEAAAASERTSQVVTNASDTLPPPVNFTEVSPVQKKKKWPKVLGVTVGLAAVIAVAVFVAWPLLEGIINPKSKAVAALKNAGASFEKMVNKALDGEYAYVSNMGDSKTLANLEVKKASLGGVDYLPTLPAKHIRMDIEASMSEKAFAGSIGLGTSAGTSDLTLNCYADSSRIYISVPTLLSQPFYIKNTYAGSSGTTAMAPAFLAPFVGGGSVTMEDLKQYAPALKSLVKDVMNGVNGFIDNLEYNTIGNETYASENGDIGVTAYEVTVKEKMVKDLLKTALVNILDDGSLSSYTAWLLMAGGGKDAILGKIDQLNMKMPDVKFTIYVNKDKKIVKVIVELKQFDARQLGYGQLSVEFIGKDDPMDYVILQMTNTDGTRLRAGYEAAGDKASVKLEVWPDQTKNKGEFVNFGMTSSRNNSEILWDGIYAKGKVNGREFDLEVSGKTTTSPLARLSKSTSDFKGAVNADNLTAKQQQVIMSDLTKNASVLKKVLPTLLVNQILTGGIGR